MEYNAGDLVLPCECGMEIVRVSRPDEYGAFLAWFKIASHSWRWRVKAAWALLTGHEVVLNEVVLTPSSVTALRDWLVNHTI